MQVDQHRERTREEAAAELVGRIQRSTDSAEIAVVSTDLENLAAVQLVRPDLSREQESFWKAAADIADTGRGELPELPTPAPEVKLAEPRNMNAPQVDRIRDLLCAEQKADLREKAADVPHVDRERLLGQYEIELASEGNLELLNDAERAAARLLLDERTRDEHIERLSREVRESGERLAQMAEKTMTGVHLSGF